MLPCVGVCCSMLQCVAVGSDPLFVAANAAGICIVLSCVAVCCSILLVKNCRYVQCVAVCCSVLQLEATPCL